MTQGGGIARVLEETRRLAARHGPLASLLPATLPLTPPVPRPLPATARLQNAELETCPDTAVLTAAVQSAAADLRWEQSYSEAQVGAAHLAGYAYVNLISPAGPYVCDTLRVSIGFWDTRLHYPIHSHTPSETYCVLAGHATFHAEGRAPRAAGPGDLIHHTPDQPHGFDRLAAPLLLIAFWHGTELMRVSHLEAQA